MFLLTITGQFHFLLSTLILTFSHVCQIYIAVLLIIHFCNYYHLRDLSPYEYQSEVNFGGSTPDPYLCFNFLTLIKGPPQLQLWFHLCLTLGHWGQLWIQIQLQIHIWVVHFYLNLLPISALVPFMSHLSSLGVNSRSSSRSIFGLFFLTLI